MTEPSPSAIGYILMGLFGTRAVLEHHLTECTDRYKAVAEAQRRSEDKIDATRREVATSIEAVRAEAEKGRARIYALLWTVAFTAICGLLSTIATLILKLLHP